MKKVDILSGINQEKQQINYWLRFKYVQNTDKGLKSLLINSLVNQEFQSREKEEVQEYADKIVSLFHYTPGDILLVKIPIYKKVLMAYMVSQYNLNKNKEDLEEAFSDKIERLRNTSEYKNVQELIINGGNIPLLLNFSTEGSKLDTVLPDIDFSKRDSDGIHILDLDKNLRMALNDGLLRLLVVYDLAPEETPEYIYAFVGGINYPEQQMAFASVSNEYYQDPQQVFMIE